MSVITTLSQREAARVRDFIDARLEGRLVVSDIAVHFGYSTSHFHRLFARTFGRTPHCYVMDRRIAAAKELLRSSQLPLVEIALRSGFSDQSHLSHRFIKSSGLTPLSFRKICQQDMIAPGA